MEERKRKLRWISGVKKRGSEKEGTQRGEDDQEGWIVNSVEGKPQGSLAGVGKELVGVFNEVMKVLKEKDDLGVQKGEPKKCWFVLSVEEVVQPLRLQAREVAEFWDRATTIDFVTMYPEFDHELLKERLGRAVEEAWHFKEEKVGGKLRISIKGWVDASCETGVREWDFREVMEMAVFVIDNGFWKRGNRIKRQVKGFGMGLPCAPQMANPACYIPEREFASLCKAEEVQLSLY